MGKQTKISVTGKVIAKSSKISASKVYVPLKLRSHVKTVKTSAGTRLAQNSN